MSSKEKVDPAAEILVRAEALVDDLELKYVSSWKEKNPGMPAVGHLPIYTPTPLLEAVGALPVAIYGGGDQIDIIKGDSYFQSYICHIPRSVIELGLGGQLDPLDGAVFPSTCDVIRNLGGMWRLLFPKKYMAYLDLPQNFDPNIGGKFYAHELGRIARELQAHGAKPLTDEALLKAIADENERREVVEQIDRARDETPWLLRASEAYLIVRAGAMLMARDHTKLMREFLEKVKDRTSRPFDNVRCVLRGAFCEQPPVMLIRALKKAGCDIIDDDMQLGTRMLSGKIVVKDGQSPLEALAMAFLHQGCQTAVRYVADGEKGTDLVEAVRKLNADGVIFAAASFCDPALLEQPMLESALTRQKIPFTSFKYSENTGQFHVIREQAGAFSDAVKLWGSEA